MAETDILNPVSKWVDDIRDNPSPDYGFSNNRPDLRVRVKPPAGYYDSREVANDGRTITLSWINRSYECMQHVCKFAAQFEDEYCTIIDHDGGGRHYVGHFEGDLTPIQNSNDSYDLRDAKFVEDPGAPMLKYPNDWNRDGIVLNVSTVRGKMNAAISGTWNAGVLPLDDINVKTLTSSAANDWLQMQYRGYAFIVEMAQGRSYGQCRVYLDGVLQTPIDINGNALSQTIDCYADQDDALMSITFGDAIPLDLHRVKVVALGTKNPASSGGTGVRFIRLWVMR